MAAPKTNPGLGGAYSAFRGTPRPYNPAWNTAAWQNVANKYFAANPSLAPGAPRATAPAAAAPAAPPPDPRDAIFGAGVNDLIASTKGQHDSLTAQIGQGTQDFNTMLGRMADQRAQDLLATNHAANKQGLFYSGQLGKQRGNVEKSYGQREGDARTAYNRQQTALQSALDSLGGLTADASSPLGYSGTGQAGRNLASLYAEAIQRRTTANAAG